MVTTKAVNTELMLATQAITDREGAEMLELYHTEGDAEQVIHHFERNYRTLHISTLSGYIVRTARELLGDKEFLRLLDDNHYAAPLHVLYNEGVVSIVGNHYVVSAEYRKANYPVLR